jgi:2-oxoglutarate ferredoxin oxidoreductase subunit alpha
MSRQFMKGNVAVAEAAIRAGCRFFSGYPITPQNDIPEYMARRMPEVGGSFVQGESEVASICMVYGAASTGTLAMTSSSGPGISLKAEGISTLAGAELPAVIVNVMRGGPGLGAIQPAQADYLMATKASGHGGFRMLVYAPSTVQEAADLTYLAFDRAEKYLNPVMIAMDGCIGSLMEGVVLPEFRPVEKRSFVPKGRLYLNPNNKVTTSCLQDPEPMEEVNIRAARMYDQWQVDESMVEEYLINDAEVIVTAYGIVGRIAMNSVDELRKKGMKVGLIRPITIHPFPYDSLRNLDYSRVKHIVNIEMSIPAQMLDDVSLGVMGRAPIKCFGRSAGVMMHLEEAVEAIERIAVEE